MYQTNNTWSTTFPLDKESKKRYTESTQMKLNLAAFDDDKVAGSAVDYLYAPGNQSKTQTFLKSNGFPSAQEREFNKAMQGVEQERKNLAATLKSAVKGTASTEHYGEFDRGFLKGLLGDEEGEREYQKRVANVNSETTRKQNELLNAFKGSQFESLLKPSAPVSGVAQSRTLRATNPTERSVLDPLREHNATQYFDTKTIPSTATQSGYNGNESLYAYSGNKSASQIKTSGTIQEPGYNKKGAWSENPDADNYGENSAKYKMLVALDSACMNTTDEKQKEKYKKAAKMIRNHHANVDSSDFTKVLLLNNQNGAMTAGHNAVLLINSANEGVLFSFNPEGGSYPWANGQMRMRLLTSNQVNVFKETGNIFDATSIGSKSVVSTSETYTRYIEIPISKSQGSEMLRGAIGYYAQPGGYGIVAVKQCDDMASSIMSCGNKGYFVFPFPNDSFTNVSEDWGYPIKNIKK